MAQKTKKDYNKKNWKKEHFPITKNKKYPKPNIFILKPHIEDCEATYFHTGFPQTIT